MINAMILFDSDDHADMEVLPLMRIVMGAGENVGTPRSDPSFAPASLPGIQRNHVFHLGIGVQCHIAANGHYRAGHFGGFVQLAALRPGGNNQCLRPSAGQRPPGLRSESETPGLAPRPVARRATGAIGSPHDRPPHS